MSLAIVGNCPRLQDVPTAIGSTHLVVYHHRSALGVLHAGYCVRCKAAETQAELFSGGYAELRACLDDIKSNRQEPPRSRADRSIAVSSKVSGYAHRQRKISVHRGEIRRNNCSRVFSCLGVSSLWLFIAVLGTTSSLKTADFVPNMWL